MIDAAEPHAAMHPELCVALLRSVGDAIIQCDRDGTIRFWNPGAERIFGFAAAEALGRSLDIIIPERQRARHWAGFQAVMESGRSRYGEGDILAVPGQRKDGTRISIEFTILMLQDSAGAIDGMVAVLRDVTRRFEELRSLRRRVAELTRSGDSSATPTPRS